MHHSQSKKLIFLALIAAAIFAAYTVFFGTHPTAGGMMGGAAPVSVAEVISRKVQMWSEFSGRLVAVDSSEIRARVSGTVERIHFTEGQWVKKGQPLFVIDQRPYAAALQAAQARASLAEAEYARARRLISDKAIPQREFDQRKSEVEAARAELTKAKLDVDYSVVKSPISGRVGRAEITVGNLIDAGGNAPILTTVVANKPIYADFEIDEQSYLRYIQAAGATPEKLKNIAVNLTLSGVDAAAYQGRVQSFDNKLDTNSGTLRVRAIFDNKDGSLIPGLFASVRLGSVEDVDSILITDRAIKTDQSVKYVWVVGEDNKVSYRPVTLGGMVDGLRVITEGLKAGEKIVVNGTQRIMMPDQPITPQMVAMDAKEDVPTEKKPEENPAEKPSEENKSVESEAK
jgi:multidrug efflux system membrane fusion protein